MFGWANIFFTDLGLDTMTDTFWAESMIERPSDDREVVCHASAEEFFFGPGDNTSVREDWRLVITLHIVTCLKKLNFISQHQNVYHNHPRRFRDDPPWNGAHSVFHELPQPALGLPQRRKSRYGIVFEAITEWSLRIGSCSGFHEAIGDTIALAVSTPAHLQGLGLLPPPTSTKTKPLVDNLPPPPEGVSEQELNYLLSQALEKVLHLIHFSIQNNTNL